VSTDITHHESNGSHEVLHDHDEVHGASHDSLYVMVFVALVVITAVEVWLSYSGLPTAVFLPSLLFLMAVKFFAVVSVFMHLRFETASIFGRLFYVGLVTALVVYVATLTTFEFWVQ
jgi:cytochrome c oxidase subunit IV